jgi:hypothetical protein
MLEGMNEMLLLISPSIMVPVTGTSMSKQKMIGRHQHCANKHLPLYGLKASFHQF